MKKIFNFDFDWLVGPWSINNGVQSVYSVCFQGEVMNYGNISAHVSIKQCILVNKVETKLTAYNILETATDSSKYPILNYLVKSQG